MDPYEAFVPTKEIVTENGIRFRVHVAKSGRRAYEALDKTRSYLNSRSLVNQNKVLEG